MRRLCLKGFVKAIGDKKGRVYEVIDNVKGNDWMQKYEKWKDDQIFK